MTESSAEASEPTSDHLRIALTEDGGLRVRAAITTGVVAEAARRHQPSPWALTALGRALTSLAVFPAEWAKYDRISVQWKGQGPLRTVFAELRSPGSLRGYVGEPALVLPGASLRERGASLGLEPPGLVVVMRQRPRGNHDLGQAVLTSGQVDEDLEHFFETSDQVPSRLWTGVLIDEQGQLVVAGGVLIQHMPDGRELPPPVDDQVLRQALLASPHDPSGLVQAALGEPVRELQRVPLVFACPCTRDRMEDGLAMLREDDLRALIEEDGGAELTCQFCATRYSFSKDELQAIAARRGAAGEA